MIGRIALNEIQNLVYDTLVASSAGWSVSAGIFDEPPETATFPYIEIAETTDTTEGTKGVLFSDNQQIINVWSDATGSKECNDIINQVIESIMGISLPSVMGDNFQVDTLDRGLVQLLKLEGPNSHIFRQGVIRFSLRVEDTS
jgi:hypothetical protein